MLIYDIIVGEVKKMKTKTIILAGIFAAVIAVFSVITFKIGPVPVTLSTFAILLSAVILGGTKSTLAVAIYILCGACGLPVFSGFRGGISILFGSTGGYILSYVLMALLVGFAAGRTKSLSPLMRYLALFLACAAALFLCYALGTLQYVLITGTELSKALWACVYPFIPFDIIKATAAIAIGLNVKKGLNSVDL